MYMGPLEAQKPWNTRDIVGMSRFLNYVWRIIIGEEDHKTRDRCRRPHSRRARSANAPCDQKGRRGHRGHFRFNTAIAELIELNNAMIAVPSVPRELAENFVLMLSPFAPHLAEELWDAGPHKTLARRPWPTFDPSKLVDSTMELPVQVNGKLRGRITVPSDATEQQVFDAAAGAEAIKPWLEGKQIVKRIYVAGKLANFVVK